MSRAVVEPGWLRVLPQCFLEYQGCAIALLLKGVMSNIGKNIRASGISGPTPQI
jgi:hypothetical protein